MPLNSTGTGTNIVRYSTQMRTIALCSIGCATTQLVAQFSLNTPK